MYSGNYYGLGFKMGAGEIAKPNQLRTAETKYVWRLDSGTTTITFIFSIRIWVYSTVEPEPASSLFKIV